MKKTTATAAILLTSICFYTFWIGSKNESTPNAPAKIVQATEVVVQTIRLENIDIFQDLPGRTQAFKVAEIRPQVSGIIIKKLFEEGSDVKEKQQLYQIDDAPYQAAYNSALANLKKAEANLKSSKTKYARYNALVKVGSVSNQEYDDVSAALSQSEAEIAIAKAAVATAKINLDYTKVCSPISGRIGKSSITEGALVTANQAPSLAVVQQLDKIYVDVTQSITALQKMRKMFGEKSTHLAATLTIEGDNAPYSEQGVLQFTDVTVDPGTGTTQLRILFENPKIDLLPGMFVKAKVTQGQATDSILVPQEAVTRNANGSTSVWLVDNDDKVKVQTITVSKAIGRFWLVLSGLNAGDRIVVEGIPKISPGAHVKPTEAPQAVQPSEEKTQEKTQEKPAQ